MKTIVRSVLDITLICCACGCSSASPVAPESPPAPTASQSIAKPVAEASAPSTTATESATAPVAEPAPTTEPSPPSDGLRKASRPPLVLITNPTALYVFNFSESEVGKTAKEQCNASGGTADEKSACLQKARSKVPVESMRFLKKGNEYWWITLNRYKGNLLKWHVIQFQLGEETSDRVTLKPIGKDKGIAPMARVPRTLEIELPNDYSIVVNDPEFGKMTFDEKIGKIED